MGNSLYNKLTLLLLSGESMSVTRIRASKDIINVLPKKLVKNLGLKGGEELEIRVKKIKKSSVKELKGLGKNIWENIDVEQYIKTERKSWERPSKI